MEAKKKALELGNKFYQGNPLVYSKLEHLSELEKAKSRALICVDEILNALDSDRIIYGSLYRYQENDYWQKVKKEINNL